VNIAITDSHGIMMEIKWSVRLSHRRTLRISQGHFFVKTASMTGVQQQVLASPRKCSSRRSLPRRKGIETVTYFSGKTILVTGASDGIGRDLVEQLDSHGAQQMILIGRDLQRLGEVADECGTETRIESVDLACQDQLDALLKRLEGVQIDVLINNAGVGLGGAFEGHEDEQRITSMIRLNCDAVVLLTRAILPAMLRRQHGAILMVGSLAGWAGGPGMCVYSATKGFVNRFAEGLRWELAGTGVLVSLLAPGVTRTSFFRSAGIDERDIRSGSMTSKQVARQALNGLARGRAIIVPGLRNRMLLFIQGWVPRGLVGWVSRRVFAPIMKRQQT